MQRDASASPQLFCFRSSSLSSPHLTPHICGFQSFFLKKKKIYVQMSSIAGKQFKTMSVNDGDFQPDGHVRESDEMVNFPL